MYTIYINSIVHVVPLEPGRAASILYTSQNNYSRYAVEMVKVCQMLQYVNIKIS